MRTNELGLKIGDPVPDWRPRERPPRTSLEGIYCKVEPIDPCRHAAELFEANAADAKGSIWVYLPYGPFGTLDEYREWMESACLGDDPVFHAVIDNATGKAVGIASYLRIDPSAGSIEVGHINYSPLLQRTRAATEAMFLMMRRAFSELGYRRYEWKCDSLNERSRRAAVRLGFTHEGIFRQARINKGRNRDDAWYSIVSTEWPALEQAFMAWLSPANFDEDGRQKAGLDQLVRKSRTVRLKGC